MGLFGLTFERRYPVYGLPGACRAMTAEEIMTMQGRQAAAAQNAWSSHSSSLLCQLGLVQHQAAYQPAQRPLDERFSDFKRRLAVAIKRNSEKEPTWHPVLPQ